MDLSSTCRFCLTETWELTSVTEEQVEVIKTCLGINLKVIVDSNACFACSHFLTTAIEWKQMCLLSESQLVEYQPLPSKKLKREPSIEIYEDPIEKVLVPSIDLSSEDGEDNDFECNKYEVYDDYGEEVTQRPKPTKEKEKPLKQCPVCMEWFIVLTYHMKIMHGIAPAKKSPQQARLVNKLVRIKRHQHKCQYCGAEYSSASGLLSHIKVAHVEASTASKSRKFAEFTGNCVCGVVYLSRVSFNQHLKVAHTNHENHWTCPCGRIYMGIHELKKHMDRTHGIPCVFHSNKIIGNRK